MALWGNNDAVGSGGTVSLDYDTLIVTGTATTFGNIGAAKTGDVIRFGDRDGTYMGDAVIVSIASTTQLTIGSTAGLSGVAIAGTDFNVSELPLYTVGDSKYSEASWGTDDSYVYGVGAAGTATGTSYEKISNLFCFIKPLRNCYGNRRMFWNSYFSLINFFFSMARKTWGNITISFRSTWVKSCSKFLSINTLFESFANF